MTQPHEMKLNLPMSVANNVLSTTTKVWEILVASKKGDLSKIKELVAETPELIYAQYNYTPPVHFAVREGHIDLVKYLLEEGAFDPAYRTYPFVDNLVTIADDRGSTEIAAILIDYAKDDSKHRYKKDNGEIHYDRSPIQIEFQKSVNKENYKRADEILKEHPEFAKDDTYFWGEGILTMPAKECNWKLIDLLMSHGAKIPPVLKWCQFYYFEKYNAAVYLMEKGMDPNTKSWQEVTLLHDMAQKGNIPKAELLLKYGAAIDPIDDEYSSTPLGMAARWGQIEMVEVLLRHGADVNRSGAAWSTPLAWARKKGHKEIETVLIKAGGK